MDVKDWKQYLKNKRLYSGNVDNQPDAAFRKAMVRLEDIIVERAPAVQGMIWRNGEVNPRADIKDVDEALGLLAIGVANFDALGPPDAPNFIGTPFNQMFISQDDSKANETDPTKNQNQGTWQNPAPKHPEKTEKPEQKPVDLGIDERMKMLVQLMEDIKK